MAGDRTEARQPTVDVVGQDFSGGLETVAVDDIERATVRRYCEPLERLLRHYLGGVRPEIVVCGDTHFEQIDVLEDVFVVNPGSATLPHTMSTRLGHVAFLTLARDEAPHAEIVDLAVPDWRERAGRSQARRLS